MALTENQLQARSLSEYYRRRFRWWQAWKWPWYTWLTVGLCLAAGAVLATGVAGWDRQRYAPGPVAAVHARWETDCAVCHAPSTGFGTARVDSERCADCHSGHTHHQVCQGAESPCASCHREHRGRQASLLRVTDGECTRCHNNLDPYTDGEGPVLGCTPKVSGFARPPVHPEIRPVRDFGKLKFDHALHLTAGMAGPNGNPSWTLARISRSDRERYRHAAAQRDKADTALVQLECASCHRLDPEDLEIPVPLLPGGTWPPRGTGAYPLPILFEVQCRACHALAFDVAAPDLEVPHRLQPPEVRRFLAGIYAADYLRDDPNALERRQSASHLSRRVPGRRSAPHEEEAVALIRTRVEKAERYLYGSQTSCKKCHYYAGPDGQAPPVRMVPPELPALWFEKAAFNHRSHRAVTCRECHPAAYPDNGQGGVNPEASRSAADVLIPGSDTCLKCHAPRAGATGGARFDCAECHPYHNRDQNDGLLAGPGAAAREPRRRLATGRVLVGVAG